VRKCIKQAEQGCARVRVAGGCNCGVEHVQHAAWGVCLLERLTAPQVAARLLLLQVRIRLGGGAGVTRTWTGRVSDYPQPSLTETLSSRTPPHKPPQPQHDPNTTPTRPQHDPNTTPTRPSTHPQHDGQGAQRQVHPVHVVLREHRHAHAGVARDEPLHRLQRAGYEPQQRALADAVGADDGGPALKVQPEVEVPVWAIDGSVGLRGW